MYYIIWSWIPANCRYAAICAFLPSARQQLLKQSGIGRFDVEPLRERGPWRFADASQDLRVLVVSGVQVPRQAHDEKWVTGELAFEQLRPGLGRHSLEALRVFGKSRFPYGLRARLDEWAQQRIGLETRGHGG